MGLDGVELVLAVEEEFEIDIPEEDAANTDTVGKFVDMVYSHLRQNEDDSRIWLKEEVFEKIREIAVEQLGVRAEQVTPEAKWIEDLGAG